jgi:hypothetical protein
MSLSTNHGQETDENVFRHIWSWSMRSGLQSTPALLSLTREISRIRGSDYDAMQNFALKIETNTLFQNVIKSNKLHRVTLCNLAEAVTPRTCIQNIFGLNLSRSTDYLD